MAVGDLTFIKIDPYVLTTSAATLYTIPSNRHVISSEFVFCNTTANPQEQTVYFVPSGGTAADGNAIIKNDDLTELVRGESKPWKSNQFLGAGDFIQVKNNNGTAVTLHVSLTLRSTA